MSIYDINVTTIDGQEKSLADYRGKVLIIVNTASKCGLTPQFEGLQALYDNYQNQEFDILGFPCNQFKDQDPGNNEEIHSFCQQNYGVTFPMFAKIDVNGDNEHPLYTLLKTEKGGLMGSAIKWNFTKFLIDKQGKVVKRYAPTTEPKNIEKDIQSLLAK